MSEHFRKYGWKNNNDICKPRLLDRNASGKKLICTNPSGPTTTDWLRTNGHVKLSSMYPHHPMYRTFWTSQVPSSIISIYWRWHALTIGHCKWAGGYTLKHGVLTYLSSVNGHFSKTIAWFVRHNPTAKKWMQVILILENQERPNVFAFYKYLLATPKKLYSHPQDDTSFMMIHHLFSWISYISILLGVLKIMNHISPTLGDRIQTCTAGRSTSPWAVALALFKRTAGADVQPCIHSLINWFYPFLKISSVNVYVKILQTCMGTTYVRIGNTISKMYPKKIIRIAGWLTVFMSAPRKTKHLFPHPCPELRTIWESGHNGFVPTQQPRHEMEPHTLCMIWAGLHAWFGPDGNQKKYILQVTAPNQMD